MKLAEALQERADLNRHFEQLRSRIIDNAIVQEGEQPPENPMELLTEFCECIKRQEELIVKINVTNCKTIVDGISLTEMIAKKDCLAFQLQSYRNFVSSASQIAHRATRTEIKLFSAIPVKELQSSIDEMAKELRLLNNKIQETNWKTELLDEI